MMLMKSCSFMCSISCSLLVDSKLQTGQQKSSMQYSRAAFGTPVPPFLTGNPDALWAEGRDVFSFWFRMIYGRSADGSRPNFEGTTGDLMPGTKKQWQKNEKENVWKVTLSKCCIINQLTKPWVFYYIHKPMITMFSVLMKDVSAFLKNIWETCSCSYLL